MPSPQDILNRNFAATRFNDLTVDLLLTTSQPFPDSKTVHLLSKWEQVKGTLNVMGRVDGRPRKSSFLISQHIDEPIGDIDLQTKQEGDRRRHIPFTAWDPLPGTELKYVDQVLLPPGTYTATELPAGTATQGPGAVPAVPCWIVELQLVPPGLGGPSPDRMRLWIEQSNAVEHRIEQYSGTALMRVIVADGWVQDLRTSKWGAAMRTFIDAGSGRATSVTIQSYDPAPLKVSTFSFLNFESGMW